MVGVHSEIWGFPLYLGKSTWLHLSGHKLSAALAGQNGYTPFFLTVAKGTHHGLQKTSSCLGGAAIHTRPGVDQVLATRTEMLKPSLL